MEPEDVDRSALAPYLVRHLEVHGPAGVFEALGGRAFHQPMVVIEKAVELGAAPGGGEVQSGVESLEHAPDRFDRGSIDVAALDQRYECLGTPDPICHIALSPAATAAERSKDQADCAIVDGGEHGPQRVSATYPPATPSGAGLPPRAPATRLLHGVCAPRDALGAMQKAGGSP